MTTRQTIELRNINFFPTDIRHPETGEWIRIVDYHRPYEYQSGIFAFVDPETGDYGGLLAAKDGLHDSSPVVETREQ